MKRQQGRMSQTGGKKTKKEHSRSLGHRGREKDGRGVKNHAGLVS